jgi:hypothetical protein
MRFGLTTLAAAGVLMGTSAAPVFAQPADLTPEAMATHLEEVGAWVFTTRAATRKGKPLCTEVWRFRANGLGTVQSGAELLTTHWRTEPVEGGYAQLSWRSLVTNGAPDCTGTANDAADSPKRETKAVVLFVDGGSALLCNAPPAASNPDTTLSDARVVKDEDCWGRLAPAPALQHSPLR